MHRSIFAFLSDIFRMRSVVFELAKRDFQQQYMGSYLGLIWIFLQPLLFVSVLYLVFTLGFRVGKSTHMPFSVYLVTGMIVWLYFAQTLSSNTNVIGNYSFLVKKVDFRLSILPVVKMISALVPHIVLVIVAIVVSWFEGYAPTQYTIQIVYYLFSVSVLLMGLGWLTSSTSIFIRDVSKLVDVFIQFGFWLTPIFWNIEMVPASYQWIVKINPVYYIVTGYRDSIVGQVPFWSRPELTAYYWILTIFVLLMGVSVYRRLRPHFAEVI